MTRQRQRASLYVRLSRAADAENMSLDGMINDMRALCDREGLQVLEPIHVDDGKSGGFRDREGFEAWLNDARSGRCDVLVPYHTDRLTREGLNVAAMILDTIEGKDPATGRLTHRPVRLVDCFGLDSLHGDAFRFRFVIQAEVGRSERERIKQRNRDRARRLRRAGRWSGGETPFGYTAIDNPDGPGKVLAVEPNEAKALCEAADAILRPTDPDNPTRVARRLNHAGVKPRRAAQWSRHTLVQVLTSDTVLGRVIEHGRPLKDADGNFLTPFPAVLTVGQVTALRAALAVKEPNARKGGRRPVRLLSGLLNCHSCLSVLRVDRRSAKTKGPEVVYRCNTRGLGGTCEKPVTVSALAIEGHITDLYLATVGHMPMYQERTVVSGLEELAAVEADIKETLADLATDADADTFARLQRLQARQKELSAMDPDKRTELVPTGQTMAEHWEGAMVDDRRDLLDNAFEELVILPGRRGPKGFDTKRLVRRWAEGPEAGEGEDSEE
ncbi:recombinase family protein [Streptomyces sp. NPDC000851]